MEPRRGDQLQEARGDSFPDTPAVLDIERGQLATIRPYLLADRYVHFEKLLGVRQPPGLQDGQFL